MSEEYSCEGCPYNDPDADPNTAICGFDWEGLCWKEVRDGKAEIVMDSFGNLMAIPTDNPRLII